MNKWFYIEKYGDIKNLWLFGRMVARKNDRCYSLLKRAKDGEYIPDAWYTGWHDWKFEITYQECGYESPYGELHISLFGWYSIFKMPWKSRRFPDGDCDAPRWGVAIHSDTFWVYKGGDGNMGGGSRWWTWDLPWFTWEHVRHDVQCNLGDEDAPDIRLVPYDHLQRLNDGKYIPLEENELVYKYHYDYTDSHDGTVVPCTFWVEEREWRRKWFKTFGWDATRRVSKYIEISFKDEVGPKKGSWKGGVMGCSYDLLPSEDPMDCIKRMEKERRF